MLSQVIDKALTAAKARGWAAYVEHKDDQQFQYASINVSRYFEGAGSVTANIELDLSAEHIKSRIHKTSFYSHGLESLQTAVMDSIGTLPWIEKKNKPAEKDSQTSPASALMPILDGMLRRFDRYARQLNRRHADRAGIPVNDEYDAQDLLHSLLRSITDDVRPEEVSPSYAGASSRLDFLLKKEQIVIEVKLASSKLRDKEVGEQLIVDIKRYQSHPDCKSLFCLVYDPSNQIRNPQGLESDLTGKHGNLDVKVFVVPH